MLKPYDFFFETPLYTKITIDASNFKDFRNLLLAYSKFDAYSPDLKENTTYKIHSAKEYSNVDSFLKYGGVAEFKLRCERTGTELYFYSYYNISTKEFQKTGQIPSIADLHISKVKDYAKVLGKEKLKEFTRAIGLAANGVGIGSFVYLRRIFEDLIEEAHLVAKIETDWNEEEYERCRMAEKISMLSSHLPLFLVENRTLYGILSKGIHSLEENECLAYFETVKMGIELILDEKVEIEQKKAKLEAAKAKISQLQQKISEKQDQ